MALYRGSWPFESILVVPFDELVEWLIAHDGSSGAGCEKVRRAEGGCV